MEKRRFTVIDTHRTGLGPGPWDILAKKGKDKWVIEVKSGHKPSINIENIIRMRKKTGFREIGIAVAPLRHREVYLFSLSKESLSGIKAWENALAVRPDWFVPKEKRKVS